MPITLSGCGWGDHPWGTPEGPWSGVCGFTPIASGEMIFSWDDLPAPPLNLPPTCRKAVKPGEGTADDIHGLCQFLPEMYCREDLDPNLGGTGDHHRLLNVLGDFLYGSAFTTGIANDIASFVCIIEPAEAPDRFLDALLLHLGFNLDLPLTEEEKRKIIPVLVDLYKQKGSNVGIENALSLFLGIPAQILPPLNLEGQGFECGEDFSHTLTDLASGASFVDVDEPEKFEIGKNLVIVDIMAPYGIFTDAPITNIASNRIFFDPQVLANTIQAGAQVFCDRLCDQLQSDNPLLIGGCSLLGAEAGFGSQDPALYTFYVDIQRTVLLLADLVDGDGEASVSSAEFIVKGKRVRFTDTTAPLSPVLEVLVDDVDYVANTFTFQPVSISETFEAGSTVINLFNAEEAELVNRIVRFAKVAHTHHILTRDFASAPIIIG